MLAGSYKNANCCHANIHVFAGIIAFPSHKVPNSASILYVVVKICSHPSLGCPGRIQWQFTACLSHVYLLLIYYYNYCDYCCCYLFIYLFIHLFICYSPVGWVHVTRNGAVLINKLIFVLGKVTLKWPFKSLHLRSHKIESHYVFPTLIANKCFDWSFFCATKMLNLLAVALLLEYVSLQLYIVQLRFQIWTMFLHH